MKIVNLEKFAAMPSGTLFSKFEPCIFGELCIKGPTIEHDDFLYQSIVDPVDLPDSGTRVDVLLRAESTGESIPLDLMDEEGWSRDGYYDKTQLFAVWEQCDVDQLRNRLTRIWFHGASSPFIVPGVRDEATVAKYREWFGMDPLQPPVSRP